MVYFREVKTENIIFDANNTTILAEFFLKRSFYFVPRDHPVKTRERENHNLKLHLILIVYLQT